MEAAASRPYPWDKAEKTALSICCSRRFENAEPRTLCYPSPASCGLQKELSNLYLSPQFQTDFRTYNSNVKLLLHIFIFLLDNAELPPCNLHLLHCYPLTASSGLQKEANVGLQFFG